MKWNNIRAAAKAGAKALFSPATGSYDAISKADTAIIMEIAQEFKDRSRRDLQSWKSAREMADAPDAPRWAMLQDYYDYIKPDGHLGSQIGLRISATRCNPYMISDRKTKEKNEDATAQIKQDWFFNALGDLVETALFKNTGLQFPYYKSGDMSYVKLPRRNLVPQRRLLLKETSGDVCYSLDDEGWQGSMVYAIHQSDFGIMDDIIKDLIWKKNARESWAEFSEKFGIPLVTATTPSRDKTEIARIHSMLKKLGEAATAVFPNGSKMEIHDSAAKGDPYNVYLEQVKLANEEISKRIVGGTMISDSGSSYNQSKTHEKSFAMIVEEDMTFIEFVVNKQILPKLKGYSESWEFSFDRSERLALKDLWVIVKGFLEKGADVDVAWATKKFGIPFTKFTAPTTATPDNAPTANFKKASNVLAIALGATGIVWPTYSSSCSHNHSPFASWTDIPGMADLAVELLKNVWTGKSTNKLQILRAVLTSKKLRDGLWDGWGERRLQIDYNATDHRALAAMEYNIFHFSATREKAGVLALNELLVNKDKLEINSFNEFRDAARPLIKDLDVNHLRTEWDFAVATGQGASRFNQFLYEKDTVTNFWQYQTVGDDHVRVKHALLDGRIFSFDDKAARVLWPPNDFGCRCDETQYLDDAKGKTTTGDEAVNLIGWTDKQKKIFGINRAETGEVFTANQQYVKDNGIANSIDAIKYSDYGLKDLAQSGKGKKNISVDKTITKENAAELFKPVKGQNYMGYTDHLQRKIVLKKDVFKQHTKGNYTSDKERRHQLVPNIEEALQQPDEVWFNQYQSKQFQAVYVKHYGDTSFAVTTSLGKQNLEIQTWYELKGEALRKGMLTYQKK
jgi:SPP1 gp7 family putative phage head morphogenesis protein